MKPRKIPKILSQIVWRSYRIAKRVWHLQKSNYTEGQYIKFKQTFLLLRIRRGTFDLIAWVCILTLLRKYRLLKRSIRLSVPISVKNLKCHKMSAFIENANSCLNAQYFAFGFMSFLGRVERIFPIPLSKTVLPRIKLGAMTLFGGYVDFGCSNKWNKRLKPLEKSISKDFFASLQTKHFKQWNGSTVTGNEFQRICSRFTKQTTTVQKSTEITHSFGRDWWQVLSIDFWKLLFQSLQWASVILNAFSASFFPTWTVTRWNTAKCRSHEIKTND